MGRVQNQKKGIFITLGSDPPPPNNGRVNKAFGKNLHQQSSKYWLGRFRFIYFRFHTSLIILTRKVFPPGYKDEAVKFKYYSSFLKETFQQLFLVILVICKLRSVIQLDFFQMRKHLFSRLGVWESVTSVSLHKGSLKKTAYFETLV